MNDLFKRYKEIFIDTIIALPMGIVIGSLEALFGWGLVKVTDIRNQYFIWLIPFLAFAGLLIIFLYKKVNEECLKGMTLIFQTGLGKRDGIPMLLVPLVVIATWITHLFGGSAGREGVAVQLGGTVGHAFGKRFKRPNNARNLLIVGMAAGFSGLFQTPLAATVFALEVLVVGEIQYSALIPAITAAFISCKTSNILGIKKSTVSISDTLTWDVNTITKVIFISVCFGVIGTVFAFLLKRTKETLGTRIKNPMFRVFLVGVLLSILLLILHKGRYSGFGTNLINSVFAGDNVYGYDWILKLLLTVLTLGTGFQGGEVTPLFSIGATLGATLATMLGMPVMLVAALGYAAVFGSATKTYFAPIVIGVEVFGTQNLLYFIIVCSIAYVFSGNHSIYGAQIRHSYFDKEISEDGVEAKRK